MSKNAPAARAFSPPRNCRIAIVASRFNEALVDRLLAGCHQRLIELGLTENRIDVHRVPGAFEIPLAAQRAARTGRYAAVICLGVILRGQTSHAQQIADAVSASLARLQTRHAIPVIHEVLLLENQAQAVVRCLDKKHNRGAEAAQTALEMARVMASLPTP